ncbi:MAG: hypothetical protein JJU45_10685 [Acidimicrobiia bacterium]|nr:hypothetical protein [Acidimicrobiia bacterium]
MTLRALHEVLAWVVVGANTATGAWALAANWVEPLRHRLMWWAIGVAQASIFVQVGLGTWMVAVDGIDVANLHMVYGFVAMATVGIIYSYRQQLAPHRYLLFGLGGLFLAGLALQSMVNVTEPPEATEQVLEALARQW